jgi:hypothetical protein
MVTSCSAILEHLPYHYKVNGLSLAVAAGAGRYKKGKNQGFESNHHHWHRDRVNSLNSFHLHMVGSSSRMLEHLPNQYKVKCFSLAAAAGVKRYKKGKNQGFESNHHYWHGDRVNSLNSFHLHMVGNGNRMLEHLPNQYKVKGFSLAAAASTGG